MGKHLDDDEINMNLNNCKLHQTPTKRTKRRKNSKVTCMTEKCGKLGICA